MGRPQESTSSNISALETGMNNCETIQVLLWIQISRFRWISRREWSSYDSIPRTITEVRSFLGLAGYYRKFIDNYATLVSSLTDLTKKGCPTKVIWTDETDRAFNTQNDKMSSSPILRLPDFDRQIVLRTDASDTGLGAVLLQIYDGIYFPVAYASKKLSSAQMSYAVIERECLAIVWALETFEMYLYGR